MIVAAISALCLLITLNMSTSYDGLFNNLRLMQDKQNYVTVSSLGVLVGLALFFFSEKKYLNESENGAAVNHHSNFELSKKTIHRFEESEKNIQNDSYKLYLVEKYKISKNEVLNKFVLENKLFENLAEVLQAALILDSRIEKDGDIKTEDVKNAMDYLTENNYSVQKNTSDRMPRLKYTISKENFIDQIKYSDMELVKFVEKLKKIKVN